MKQQRPAAARAVTDGMKLHRHLVRLAGGVRTVITLRPGTAVRFSTNRFHDTWHVLSDDHGAQLLARLLWGLSYQARPGTIVLIDGRFLTPTPFDADPADPIVLVPGWCTAFDDRVARELKSRLPLSNPEGTVRWRTFGLDRTLEPAVLEDWWDRYRHREEKGRVSRRGGLLVLAPGSPDESRAWALQAARLDTANRFGSDYAYLGPWDRGYDGEIQVFRRFRPMVNVAARARAQVLSRPGVFTGPDDLRSAVWREAEFVRGDAHLRVREWQGSTYTLGREAAAMLAHADVATLDDLAEVGSVEAYRRMRAADVRGLSLEMLWAIEGALTYRDRRSIGADRRRELLAELGPQPALEPIRRRRHRAPIRRVPCGYDHRPT
ncbi:TfoX/Sxy family DNA transformation protein [Nocardia sp. NPDC059240]|uniref:TfoX/Sxy family DNA transformation protein n=1 Tax=Nocardia sp. NPDC059240 TaxID=3346786 RepID=UPI0036844C08